MSPSTVPNNSDPVARDDDGRRVPVTEFLPGGAYAHCPVFAIDTKDTIILNDPGPSFDLIVWQNGRTRTIDKTATATPVSHTARCLHTLTQAVADIWRREHKAYREAHQLEARLEQLHDLVNRLYTDKRLTFTEHHTLRQATTTVAFTRSAAVPFMVTGVLNLGRDAETNSIKTGTITMRLHAVGDDGEELDYGIHQFHITGNS